jgi:Tol biopolymer transport system component
MKTLKSYLILNLFFFSASLAKAQIYVANIDGSGIEEVGSVPYDVASLSISHDGKELLFVGRRTNTRGPSLDERRLFSMRIDGSKITQLSPNTGPEIVSAVFGPDDKLIFFEEFNAKGVSKIFSADRKWKHKKLVVEDGLRPQLNSSGDQLVFEKMPCKIFVSKSDGTEEHQLSGNPCAHSPSFDPINDKRILYCEHSRDIVTVNSDGTKKRVLFGNNELVLITHPIFTPNGTQIIYGRPQRQWDLFIVNADGSNPHELLSFPAVSSVNPVVSPDGKKLYFSRFSAERRAEFEKYLGLTEETSNGRTRPQGQQP